MHEARLSQPPQVTRGGRLDEPELRAHHVDELASGHLAVSEALNDPATSRISQDSERIHAITI